MHNTPLPPLPKQHKTREADFGIVFRAWIDTHRELFPKGASFEIKQCAGGSLPFNAVADEQVAFGLRIERVGEFIRVQGMRGEPDYVLVQMPSFVVIRYGGRSGFVVIPMEAFYHERMVSKRKSLTLLRARAIALCSVY